MNVQRLGKESQKSPLTTRSAGGAECGILNQDDFRRMISLERKRTERSRKPFLLMLLDMGDNLPTARNGRVLGKIISALNMTTRQTDVTGWYTHDCVVGVMFTEIGIEDRSAILSTIITRVSETLRGTLTFEQFNQVSIKFHVFPEDWDKDVDQRPSNPILYPDLVTRNDARKSFHAIKRTMDVIGSLAALTLFAPIFLVIALAVKATSKGPIFYRQRRIGQFGKSFVFLKFRSMYDNSDPRIHREYVSQLISKKVNGQENNGAGVYKITADPRVTPVGRFLRKSSLDELPQLWNVLIGEMSLVGPRPPIPYEFERYDIWHRRRVIEAKPGITGLWQVTGRSRISFDDMVRLDLKYVIQWSFWLDLKILFHTPGAVLSGDGAY